MRSLSVDVPKLQVTGEVASGLASEGGTQPGLPQSDPGGRQGFEDGRDRGGSQDQGGSPQPEDHHSDYPTVPAGEPFCIGAMGMNPTELVDLPEIGTVVRCKTSLVRSPARTSGRVKAVLSQNYGPTVVIQSIWGDEVIVTAMEYCRFFEECDPRDVARQYWESA